MVPFRIKGPVRSKTYRRRWRTTSHYNMQPMEYKGVVQTSFTFRNLQSFTIYEITLYAVNYWGQSARTRLLQLTGLIHTVLVNRTAVWLSRPPDRKEVGFRAGNGTAKHQDRSSRRPKDSSHVGHTHQEEKRRQGNRVDQLIIHTGIEA